jgi:hypothetical protein
VLNQATISPADASVDQARATIRDRLDAHSIPDVMVQDVATDGHPKHLEWRTAEHDGRLLVNVANYRPEEREIQIVQDGSPVSGVRDLLGTESLDGDTWTIPGLSTRLIAIE